MIRNEHEYEAIEAWLRAVAPTPRPGVREIILHDCVERQRHSRRARQRQSLALRGAVAGVLALQCLTIVYLDHQRAALLESNTAPLPDATLLAAEPTSAELEQRNLQARFRTLAVLLTDEEMNVERPSKEASDVPSGNTFPTPSANHSG